MSTPLSRRQLLRGLGFISLAGLAGTACHRRGNTAASTSPDARLAPTLAVPDDDEAPPLVCEATHDNIEGPFFKAGAPRRDVLVDGRVPGVDMHLGGRVLGADCRPLAGATLDIWHADSAGDYDLSGWNLRGRVTTARDGAWNVLSIVPGRYLNGPRYRPRHVHIKLTAPGHRALTTQLYFPHDEYNHGDPWFDPSLLMKQDIGRDNPAFWGSFDLVLATS
jgi:protocatechuate 3,4-dioxygenase beta subunit